MKNKRAEDAIVIALSALATLLCLVFGLALSAGIISAMDRPSAPTYHCDSSETMGYAAPGTSEARACWIEESK